MSWSFAILAAAWAAVLFLAPYAVTHTSSHSLLFRLASGVYLAGSLVCHQRAARSFHLWGAQLPVCARCLGLYLLVPAGWLLMLVAALLKWRPTRAGTDAARIRRWRLLLAFAALPTAATVFLEWAGIAAMTNAVRAVAALPLGAAVGWVIASALAGDGAFEAEKAGHGPDQTLSGAG